jgi:tripartite-type tricarboxylate transporter receptor subunit TctC
VKTLALTLCLALGSSLVQAQPASAPQAAFQPNRPVTLVVPYGAGGGTDQVARLFGQKLGELWRQPVVVENRAGADGAIGSAVVAKAAPDGHTLMLSVASIAINPHIFAKLPFDTLTSFTPITTLALPVVVMVATPALQFKDGRAFIEAARAAPGKYTYASTDTSTRMYSERLRAAQNLDMVHVPYKSSAQWMADIAAGVVDTGFASATSARPFLVDRRVQVLGVASPKRSTLAPDVPTFTEQGIGGLDGKSWYGLFARCARQARCPGRGPGRRGAGRVPEALPRRLQGIRGHDQAAEDSAAMSALA